MAELKTKQNDQSVLKFLNGITDENRRQECFSILEMMQKAIKEEPKMWGTSIVGFGNYHYVYESGREGDWFVIGFSPRKQSLTLYFMSGIERYKALLKKLGRHKIGKGCLYINHLGDIDPSVLKEIVEQSIRDVRKSGK